jgi:hypothetical protein
LADNVLEVFMTVINNRRVIGFVHGSGGFFAQSPFYVLQLDKKSARQLDKLLEQGNSSSRCEVTITATFHQPDRLRITETDPPDYEARAVDTYVRGDVIRVQGKPGVTCSLAVSARWGVPAIQSQLRRAASRASKFLLLRVPNRKRDVVEFVADEDLASEPVDANVAASMASAANLLPEESFDDWRSAKKA